MYDYAIVNGRLYRDGTWVHQNLYVQHEKIALISDEFLPAKETVDAKGLEVLPGLIDPHVHFELDLGWIKSVDDFYHGGIAAAYGGVTSIIDFLDPSSNAKELEEAFHKRMALAKKCPIDYHLHACIKNPDGNLEEFVKTMKRLGMNTLKLFTTYSDSGRRTYDKDIIELLKLSEKYHFLITAHIENDSMITLNNTFTYKNLLESRPSDSETTEVLKLAGYVRTHGGHFYMVHLSSGHTIDALVKQYPDILNKRFFVESCPQYFALTNDVWNREDGHLFTFAPPLRTADEQKLLFAHCAHIDTIGTDHCAFNREDKNKPLLKQMPLGIGGVEFSFGLMRRLIGDRAIDKMGAHVASIMSLPKKGKLIEGYDADLFLFKPDLKAIAHGGHGRADHSVYEGFSLAGSVVSTMSRGTFIVRDGKTMVHQGQWIPGGDIQ